MSNDVNGPDGVAALASEPGTVLQRLRFTPSAWVGLSIIGFWTVIALLGPTLAPYAESDVISDLSFAPAGEVGLLGSDYLGRDVFSRVLYGARMTMGLALLVTLVSFTTGIVLGFVAAVVGGWVDNVMSRVNDAIMAFPSIILALIVMAALGTSLPIMVLTVAVIDATRVFGTRWTCLGRLG